MATYPIDETPCMEQEALPPLNPTYYSSTYEAEALRKGSFLDEHGLDDYYPTSFTTPSSDLSATINLCLLTSPATSLHSQEDNTGFLSFDAEQALLGMAGSQSLLSTLEDQQWTPASSATRTTSIASRWWRIPPPVRHSHSLRYLALRPSRLHIAHHLHARL